MSEQQIVLAEQMCRSLMRLFGPKVSAAQDQRIALSHCSRCTPEPQMYRCPVCLFETEARWRIGLHYKANPEWCQKLGAMTARNWASKA